MRPIRVLVAKPGSNGHDRGAKVIARALRDAGMEVIYTGLKQTPYDIVQIAIEEDVDVIALHILSGAHSYLLPKVVELLRKEEVYSEILVVAGGIIPADDIDYLMDEGISKIFSPDSTTSETVKFIKNNLKRTLDTGFVDELAENIISGNRRDCARAITMVENKDEGYKEMLKDILPHTGKSHVIGITGPPGVGKSTFIKEIVKKIVDKECKVGIIAIDPTSPFTNGAILGDRIRMNDLASTGKVFIRSIATRGCIGGVASSVLSVIKILEAYGCEYIFIETVGVGQSEIEIVNIADTVAIILMPGMGDDIQTIKAGVMEIGDIFVINKADKEGAKKALIEIETMIFLKKDWDYEPKVTLAVAKKGEGIDEVLNYIVDHRIYLEQTNNIVGKRVNRVKREIKECIYLKLDEVINRVYEQSNLDEVLKEKIDNKIDVHEFAEEIIDKIIKEKKELI